MLAALLTPPRDLPRLPEESTRHPGGAPSFPAAFSGLQPAPKTSCRRSKWSGSSPVSPPIFFFCHRRNEKLLEGNPPLSEVCPGGVGNEGRG